MLPIEALAEGLSGTLSTQLAPPEAQICGVGGESECLSQSLHADQGRFDLYIVYKGFVEEGTSRSLRTDQGNESSLHQAGG